MLYGKSTIPDDISKRAELILLGCLRNTGSVLQKETRSS